MTTANLMSISSVSGKFVAQTDASKKLQDEELKVAEAFAGLMNQMSSDLNQMVDEASSSPDMKVETTQTASESYERYSYKDNKIETVEESNVNENVEEVAEDLETAEQDVLNAISEEYGVSEEEIQNLLDSMGLSVLDLLNPENLVNFIMQLTGVASGEELLLDESFLQIMETMDSLAEGLMKDLNVDREGLQELVNQMELVNEDVQMSEEFQQVVEQVVEQVAEGQVISETVEIETELPVEEVKEVKEVKEETLETKTQQVETDDNVVETEKATVEKVAVENVSTEQESFSSNQNSEGNSLLNHQSNSEQIVLNQSNVSMNNVADVAQTQFTSYMSTDTVQIMEQIVHQMKVTISAETTSMEMQLNPENLGKVYVNISSNEGVVNAQFHATNEIVKEALETQIATLRENLNQAGVKVDAIEVTIASHEFERNLEQNQQNPEETTDAQKEQMNKRRNLSVDSLDDLSGLMTEEETLVAQIMKDNGNSVDFTA